jgi:hypothetical protein
MSRLVDIRLPGPTIIDPPSFEEFQVGEVSVILATEADEEITTEAGDPLAGPVYRILETSNGLLFFSRVAT